jgi:hypothetical protein
MQGQPYRDHNRATCNDCGWTGTVDDLQPEGTPAVVTPDKPAAPVGPQRKEEPEEEEPVDSLVRRLKQRQQVLEEEWSRCRREEYRRLAHTYRVLLADRVRFLDLEATKLALRIARQIKTINTFPEQTPADEELTELRILCGTRSAVPAHLAALYVALHGKLEYGVAPAADRRAEPENLAPSWDRYKSFAAASPAARMVAQQAAEIRAADHPSVQVRCATCGRVADMSKELGGSVPVPPDGWGIVPSVEGILCPECLAAERISLASRLQRP